MEKEELKNLEVDDKDLEEVSGGVWEIRGKKPIGTVIVSGTGIEPRNIPSKNNDSYVTAYLSCRAMKLNCYKIYENEGMIWYQVGKERWLCQQEGVTFLLNS